MSNPLKDIIARFAGSSGFTRAVSTLLSGTVLALAISYLAQPILTRLYTPEAFGLFDTFVSIVALLMPFASLRYEDAIMLPEEDDEALGVLGLTLLLVIVVSILSFGLHLASASIAGWFGDNTLASFLIWIPPALLTVRFARLTELWLNRKKSYHTISAGQVTQTGVMATLRIVLSRFTPPFLPLGLIWGYVAGHVVSTALYISRILRIQSDNLNHLFYLPNIRKAAFRFRRFPRFSMPSTLLTTLQSRLPFILLLFYFDQATVGYFGRAFALFAVPLSLLGNAISQVFFIEGTLAHREETLAALTTKVHDRLVMVSLFPTLAAIITAPQIMELFLGGNWGTAGVYLQWLAPWFFLASIASPLTRLFDILERQRLDFITSAGMFIVQMGLFIAGCLTGNLMTTLILLSIGGCLARLIHITVMLRMAGVSIRSALRPYIGQFMLALPFCIVLLLVARLEISWLTAAVLLIAGIAFLALGYRRLNSSQ